MTEIIGRLLDLTKQIQQIPAPPFHESQRAKFIEKLFKEEGLKRITIDGINNVYACYPSNGSGKPLVVSAHLDTVFPLDTDLEITHLEDRIIGSGIGDNSLGVASLLGLLWTLRERRIELPGDLWLVANVCEEGLGNLRGIRAVVNRFGPAAQAYLVIEGMSLGYIQHRAVGVQRYRITVRTNGGHAWSDYGKPSAVHELALLVTQLTAIPLSGKPRMTMNVGRILGGTSINSIASKAWIELDLRSENSQKLTDLVGTVERLVEAANKREVRVESELIGQRPSGELAVDHWLVRLAKECLRKHGVKPKLVAGSTDANIPLSLGYPAVVLGVTTGAGAHTEEEFIYTKPVERGVEQLVQFVRNVWKDSVAD